MTTDLERAEAKADREINEAIAPSRPPEKKEEKQPTNYEFDIDWKSPQGRRYHGKFKAHIMGAGDILKAGIIRSGLTGGLPPESLDKETSFLAEWIATLQVVLDSGPDWSKDLVSIKETDLIWEVYKEVLQREDRFRGRSA